MKIIKKIAKILLYLFLGFIGVFLIFLLVVKVYSPGKEPGFKNESGDVIENSIAEIEDREINGVAQRLVIRGKDISNPILLRVHGGPGLSHLPPIYRHFSTSLEDAFTVCYWDQRGSWPTSSDYIPESTITLDQIVNDGLKVVEYLKSRFNQEKIYIEGYSWGTVVSVKMIRQKPEYFYAYIGIGQVADQAESELLSYNYVLSEAQKSNDTVSINKLKSFGPPPYLNDEKMWKALLAQRSVLSKYVPRPDISTSEMMQMMLFNKGASFGEKFLLFTGKNAEKAGSALWPTNATTNLFNDMKIWNVPVYLIHGEHDHQTELIVAKKYFDSIQAPIKRFYEFKGAGHIAIAWDSEKYRSIMIEEVMNE